MSKHDTDCQRRRDTARPQYRHLCTCGLTDTQVQAAKAAALQTAIAKRSAVQAHGRNGHDGEEGHGS